MDRPLEELVLSRLVASQVVERVIRYLGRCDSADILYFASLFEMAMRGETALARRLAETHDLPIGSACRIVARIRTACLVVMPLECEFHPVWKKELTEWQRNQRRLMKRRLSRLRRLQK
jgi:hypothetical protein